MEIMFSMSSAERNLPWERDIIPGHSAHEWTGHVGRGTKTYAD